MTRHRIAVGALIALFASVSGSAAEARAENDGLRASRTVLQSVNDLRIGRGLPALEMDRELMEQAQAISMTRAKRRVSGHLRGWQGLHAEREGVGCRTGKDLSGSRFISCCLYESKWQAGGVGCAYYRGRTYYTLLVRTRE